MPLRKGLSWQRRVGEPALVPRGQEAPAWSTAKAPAPQAGCSPSRAVGGSPRSPKAAPAPADPDSCGLGRLPPAPQGFLSVDSPCACSSTPVTSSLTSSVASLPKVTFCIVLLAPSQGIVPHEPRAGGLCPPASWGRGKKETQGQQLWGSGTCRHAATAHRLPLLSLS